jgi:hypothetical protein
MGVPLTIVLGVCYRVVLLGLPYLTQCLEGGEWMIIQNFHTIHTSNQQDLAKNRHFHSSINEMVYEHFTFSS